MAMYPNIPTTSSHPLNGWKFNVQFPEHDQADLIQFLQPKGNKIPVSMIFSQTNYEKSMIWLTDIHSINCVKSLDKKYALNMHKKKL